MADKKLNLMLHCGANYVDRDQVKDSQTPLATDTHVPVPHIVFTNMILEGLKDCGLHVVDEAFGLRTPKPRESSDRLMVPDAQLFGMFAVQDENPHDDYALVVGFRNSHDKTFPAAICLGSGVFVCDNLAFSAEVTIKTRHTAHIMNRLPGLTHKAVGALMTERINQDQRIEAYKATECDDKFAARLILDAAKCGAINAQRVVKMDEQWTKPNHDEFGDRNLWSLFNAGTEVLKGKDGNHLRDLPARTQKLHALMDAAAGLKTKEGQLSEMDGDDVEVQVAGVVVN